MNMGLLPVSLALRLFKLEIKKNYMSKNDIVKITEYLTIEQVAEVLGVSIRTAKDIIKGVVDFKDGGRTEKNLYNANEVNEIRVRQQQQQLAQLQKQGSNLSAKAKPEVIAEAFKNSLDDMSPEQIMQGAMAMFSIASNKIVENGKLEQQNKDLEIQKLEQEIKTKELEKRQLASARQKELNNFYKSVKQQKKDRDWNDSNLFE